MSQLNQIYITTWGYPTDNTKGNPFVKEMAEALARRGVRIVMIVVVFEGLTAILNRKKKNWVRSEFFKIEEVVIRNFLPSFLGFSRMRRWISNYQMTKQLESILHEHGRPQAFQIHYILHSSAWLFSKFLKNHNIDYVLFEHSPGGAFIKGLMRNFGGFETLNDLLNFVQGASLRLARIKKYEEKMTELYKAQFYSLPSFISSDFLDTKSNDHNDSSMPFTFISIGSLIPNKGFDLLISAFAYLNKTHPHLRLIIVGGGPKESELKEQIKNSQLGDKVEMRGELRKQEVLGLISKSQVVVVASAWETFGNTVLEGMLLGKPIVSTKCDGPETIITESTGILCERSVEDLSNALKQVFENYDSYSPHQISEHCRTTYSESAVMNQLSSLYKEKLGFDF